MGTAAYMSPEQAKGKVVDKRADIWSFGVVLYEMLTGRVLFQGETASEVMASVIMREPDLSALPANVPPSLRHVIGRCLVKDPKLRLRDIGEARLALAGADLMQAPATPSEPSETFGAIAVSLAVAAGLAIALAATGVALWRAAERNPAEAVIRFDVPPPGKAVARRWWHGPPSHCRPTVRYWPSSPQRRATRGCICDHSATSRRAPCLAPRVRRIRSSRPTARRSRSSPPDGSRRTTLDGVVSMVSEAGSDGDPRGIAWLPDGTLVYWLGRRRSAPSSAIDRWHAACRSRRSTRRKASARIAGRPRCQAARILFTVGTLGSPDNYDAATIEAVDLATGKRQVVSRVQARPAMSTSGHLLFVREANLYAVPFDVDSLTTRGSPVQVLRGVNGDTTTGASHIAMAENGTWRIRPAARWRPPIDSCGSIVRARRSRSGSRKGLYFDPRISPDGTHVAVDVANADRWQRRYLGQRSHPQDVHTAVIQRRRAVAGLVGRRQNDLLLLLDPMAARRPSCAGQPTAAATPSPWSSLDARAYLKAVTPDEKTVLLDYQSVGSAAGKGELVTLALAANAKPEPLVTSVFDEYGATWSPDRRWLAYQSDESGRAEVYVRDMSEWRRPLASLNQRR